MLPLQKRASAAAWRNEWPNIRLLLYSDPVTTSHIRNNSPDYFPTGLQFANLLENLVKYWRAIAIGRFMHSPAICNLRFFTYIFLHPIFSPAAFCFCPRIGPISDIRLSPFCATRADESTIV